MKVSRIGLINFWLYDDEEFDFYDGKLLLRGGNGAGKSVTMQSFIPVILDGNKSPVRLDPFGGTDKHMEDYLLGGIDAPSKDEATGYLYMEVYDNVKDKYLTIGMGLHAKKGRPLDFWGFLIQDGRRVGKDVLLYKSKNEKIPFNKRQLQIALGTENIVVDTTKEYKKMVNNVLFGFPSMDSYDEFINVLLQLRSPKLSKGYNPTKLMKILEGVLQPLSDEELRPLTEAVEEMDKTKERIEKITEDIKQISYLLKTVNNYSETLLYKKSTNYLSKASNLNNLNKELESINIELSTNENDLIDYNNKLSDLDIELKKYEDLKANLKYDDIEEKLNRLNTLKDLIKEINIKKNKKKELLEIKQDNKRTYENELKDKEEDLYKLNKESHEVLSTIKYLGEDLKFNECFLVLKDLEENLSFDINFDSLVSRVKTYENKLNNILKKLIEKETIESEANKYNDLLDNLNKKINLLDADDEKLNERMSNALRDLKDVILSLEKNNLEIRLSNQDKDKLLEYFKEYNSKGYNKAKTIYENISYKYHTEKVKNIANLENKRVVENTKLASLNEELEILKNNKEEELKTFEDTETIKYLKESNIPYERLYKVIEFKDNIDDDIKNKLESILLESNLLNAFLVNPKDLEKIKNTYGLFLHKSIKKDNNLTMYFKVTDNIVGIKEVEEILESISIDDKDSLYLNDSSFGIDFLKGYPSKTLESKYIGVLKRQEIRLKKIKEKEDEIKSVQSILNNIENLLTNTKEELNTLEYERTLFPSNDSLEEIKNELDIINVKKEDLISNRKVYEEKISNLEKTIKDILFDLKNLKKDINIPLNKGEYELSVNKCSLLKDNILELKGIANNYQNKQEIINNYKSRLIETDNLIDDLLVNINDLTNECKKNQVEIESIEEILNTDEYKNVKEKLKEISSKLKEIPEEKERINKLIGKIDSNIENKKESKEKLNEEIERESEITLVYEEIFKEEYNLHYIFKEEFSEITKCAKMVKERLANRENSDITSVTANYFDAFSDYKLSLNEYHLSMETIFNHTENKYVNIYNEFKRQEIKATYQGRIINIYELTKALQDTLEENNLIMNKEDQKLFHEILLTSIGKKIKEHIISSEEWVKKMNLVMNEMQKDSSLSFNLEWKSKEAFDSDELDTKELVKLFFKGTDLLNDDEKERLIKHFRSKLNKEMEYSKGIDSYANIIFKVLDYRTWFEFKMNYLRNGETRRELTDKVFAVFSGGERAKAMYIPLCAAASAKLDSARPNALRLVALDEAFAGVDEGNINEMFGIMSCLDLDYILTSQSLWGDYSQVKDLAIANLIRPKNSSCVGVQRYRWNGKTKEVILNKEIENDTIKLF